MDTVERIRAYDRPGELPEIGTLASNWWVVLLRGIAGIVFGIATFFAPAISLAFLVLLFGAYALVDGVLTLISAVRNTTNRRWWVLLIEGLVGVIAGIITFVWPGITAVALLYVIAAWALITGALEIAEAIRLRKVIDNEWLLVLSGIVSIALGVLLAMFPGPGALAVVLWIGAYALIFGILLVGLGFRLRSWERSGSLHPVHHPA
ncbi:MAG TPA: HdeD family acid-resistance protein [Candidatus Binatia bacterium]|jgi:uncharacterized membrane protein HdeD (DUF308 family)